MEGQPLIRAGMVKFKTGGMEEHHISISPCSIQGITMDGATKSFGVGCMEAELVSSASDRGELDTGLAGAPASDIEVRLPHFALFLIIDLIGTVIWIKAKGQFNLALVVSHKPIKHGDIGLSHLFILKLDR